VGLDQHRGWFQSSVLVGTGIEAGAPFEQVVTCGFVLNEQGDKMSKSRGNALSPQDVIKQSGGDILRLWVAHIDYTNDMTFGPQIMSRIADSYMKIRNSGARYLLSNLNDFDPAAAVPVADLLPIDRWILDRAYRVFDRCRQAYEEYEFHVVYHRILDLCTVDLSNIYLDVTKDTMYCDAPDSAARRSAQTAMYLILRGLVSTIAPILSFTADEVYEAMPGVKEKSVHLTDFPKTEAPLGDEELAAWNRVFRVREVATKVLERARNQKQIGKSLEADIVLHASFGPEAFLGPLNVDLAKLFIVSHVDFSVTPAHSADSVELEGLGPVSVTMVPARGKKCGRCWQYREEVREEGALCARCDVVVSSLAPTEMPTV
jgi:isoleucyl-tRNA synthetase